MPPARSPGPPAWQLATRLLRRGMDAVLPPRCLNCGDRVTESNGLCGGCWSRLRFIEAPCCDGCGRPQPHAALPLFHCEDCRRQPLAVDRARAALVYDEASRGLILNFKHGGHVEGVPIFAGWMVDAGRQLLAEADLIVPVPLHRLRLLQRGFNQSTMLGRAIAAKAGLPCPPQLLLRARATRSQQGLSGADRATNIAASAFKIAPGGGATLEGARIVIIDDVLTTGTTLAACTKVLRDNGAASIAALTLARTAKADDII